MKVLSTILCPSANASGEVMAPPGSRHESTVEMQPIPLGAGGALVMMCGETGIPEANTILACAIQTKQQ